MLAERVEVVEGLFSAEIEEMSCEIDADRRSGSKIVRDSDRHLTHR